MIVISKLVLYFFSKNKGNFMKLRKKRCSIKNDYISLLNWLIVSVFSILMAGMIIF